MKKLWMRVGISFFFTDKELEMIIGSDPKKWNMDAAIISAFNDKRFRLDGETYCPSNVVDDFNQEYGTSYPENEACADLWHDPYNTNEHFLDPPAKCSAVNELFRLSFMGLPMMCSECGHAFAKNEKIWTDNEGAMFCDECWPYKEDLQ